MPKVIIMLIIANRKVDRREIGPRVTDPKKCVLTCCGTETMKKTKFL